MPPSHAPPRQAAKGCWLAGGAAAGERTVCYMHGLLPAELSNAQLVGLQPSQPWYVPHLPCPACLPLPQHELDLEDAQQLVQHSCKFVFEGEAAWWPARMYAACCRGVTGLQDCSSCAGPSQVPAFSVHVSCQASAASASCHAGANMPCTPRAVRCFEEHGVVFGPAKAVNAGVPESLAAGQGGAPSGVKKPWSGRRRRCCLHA